MRYKDYKRLAKVSLKARKKTTRSTVRGISFGLILLMPLLFIVIAFHLDLNKEVNKDASIRVFNISYVTETPTNTNTINFIKEEYSGKVYNIMGIENIVKYNQYTFNNADNKWDNQLNKNIKFSPFSIVIGDKTFSLDYYMEAMNESEEHRYNEVGLQVIDTDIGDSIFLTADKQLTDGNPLVAGAEFSSNSVKEIMISSNLLEQYNLMVEDVLNKEITITYELQDTQNATDSETDISNTSLQMYRGIPITILKGYKIVGIFDSKIYKSTVRLDSQREYYPTNCDYETYFWITRSSVYDLNNKNYFPRNVKIEQDQGDYTHVQNSYYYSESPIGMAKNARNNDKVFLPLGMGVSEGDNNSMVATYKTLLDFKSYGDANNAVSTINSLLESSAVGIEEPYISDDYSQDTFRNYRMFYNAFTYVCIILAIFGGVVFFATLLNLYNTIHYSVQSRRNYLGMIRAIGMKGIDVIKMYFVEIFQIFKRSYIWTAIFGGGICFGISAIFNMIMKSDMAAAITINLSLNPIYILVAFLILVLINTIISIAFSLIACHSVSNKPILEVLVENR